MASGYTVNGVDLDSIFMALVGTKRADVGFSVAGQDISNRYEPIGDGVVTNVTNYKAGVTPIDIGSLFRDINEAIWSVSLSPGIFLHSPVSPPAASGIYIGSDGTIDEYRGGTYLYDQDWITPTSSASIGFDIRIVRTGGTETDFVVKPTGYNFGDWISVSGGRLFYINSTVLNDLNFINFDLSIRETGTTTVLATAGFSCTAHPTNV